MIILITASLSSKMYKGASNWAGFALVIHIRQLINFSVTVSFRFGVGVGALDFTRARLWIIDLFFSTVIPLCLMGVLWRMQYFYHHIPSDREQGFHPFAIQHPKKKNFRFCRNVTHWCLFLAHPTYGNKCSTSGKYTRFPSRLIWSLHGRPQSLSLGINPIDNAEPCFLHDNIVCGHSCDDCRLSKRAKRLSQALVHRVTARANLFTDQRMQGPPIRAKYKHSKTICEHTLDNSPTVSSSSFLKLWSSRQRVETLYNCSVFLFASSQNLRKHFVRMSSLYPVTSRKFLRVVSPTPVIFRLLRQWFVIRTSSLYSSMFSFGLHSRGVHPKHTWSGNDVASPGSTIFIKFSPFSTNFLPSSSHFDIIHVYQWE